MYMYMYMYIYIYIYIYYTYTYTYTYTSFLLSLLLYIDLHQILWNGFGALGLWLTSSVTVSTHVLGLWWSETSLTAAVNSRWYWSYFSWAHSAHGAHGAHGAHSTILEVSENCNWENCASATTSNCQQRQTDAWNSSKLSNALSISPFQLLQVPLSEKCNTGDVGIPHSARSQSKHPVQGSSICKICRSQWIKN